jgi:hypothetical protein
VTRKDVAATVLTGVAVFVFAAAHEGWGVPLVGGSARWAAGVVLLLGMATCSMGSPGRDRATSLLGVVGSVALVLAVVALVTGSLTVLSLLVAAFVLLWAVSTLRHVRHAPGTPVAT